MSFKNAALTIQRIKDDLKAGMLIRSKVAGADLSALVADRVRNKGINAKGQKFSPYSQAKVPAFFFLNRSRSTGADQRIQDLVSKGALISYADFRQINNLNIDKKNFEFTGEMWQKFNVISVQNKGKNIRIVVGGTTPASAFKIDVTSKQEGISVVEASKDELALIADTLTDWFNSIFQKHAA